MNEIRDILTTAAKLHSRVVTEWMKLPIPKQVIFWCPPSDFPEMRPPPMDFDSAGTHLTYFRKNFLELDLTSDPFENLDASTISLLPEAAQYYLGAFLKYALIQVMCLGNFCLGTSSVAFIELESLLMYRDDWEGLIKKNEEIFECVLDVCDFLYSCPVELTDKIPKGLLAINSLLYCLESKMMLIHRTRLEFTEF